MRAPHLNRFFPSNLSLGRYLLNLVQDNRKGIEAAAQQWRDGSKTDSDFIKVLEVTPQAADALHASLTAARHIVLRWRRPRRTSGRRTGPCLRSNYFAVLIVMRIEQGSQVRDTGIFRAHAARYEAEFLEDMTRLGAEPPLSHACMLLTFCRLQAVLCPTFSPA